MSLPGSEEVLVDLLLGPIDGLAKGSEGCLIHLLRHSEHSLFMAIYQQPVGNMIPDAPSFGGI